MRTSFKKILSVFLCALMLVSVVSVMGVTAAETAKKTSGEGTIILDASFCDEGGSAEWYAWTWNDESDGHWVQAIGGTSAADITYDASEFSANVLFARMNPAKHDILPAWNNDNDNDIVWNQTEDLTVDGDIFTITGWGDGWGAKLQGEWDGSHEPDPGSYTVNLDPGVAAGAGEWYAWTWTTEQGAHWVSGTESDGKYTFENICDNVIFATFWSEPNNKWTDKIGQTEDLVTEDGKTYVIKDTGQAEDSTDIYYGEWASDEEPTTEEPTTEEPTTEAPEPTTTAAPETEPEPTTRPIPTDPTAADENEYLYVSARSNITDASSKVRISGDYITVTYSLTAFEKLDDGQYTVIYDSSKLELSSAYNTPASMFPITKNANYNLNADISTAKFNFSGINGAYDFTGGGVLVNLVFTRKSADSVGTAMVYLDMEDLDSKNTSYVNNFEIKDDNYLLTPLVSENAVQETTEEQVATEASQNLIINAYSNVSSVEKKIRCNKVNAKVTFSMTVPEIIAYGMGVVSYDPSKLALEAKNNTQDSMFTTLDTQTIYNLNAGSGTMMFNFTSADSETQSGTYDFRNGGDIISLVFTVREGATGDTDVYLNLMDLGSFGTEYFAGGKKEPSADNINSNIIIEPKEAETPTEEETTIPATDPDATTEPGFTTEPGETTTAPEETTVPEQPTDAPENTTAAPENTTAAPENTTAAPTNATGTKATQPTSPKTNNKSKSKTSNNTKATQAPTVAPNKVNFSKKPDVKSAVNAVSKAKSDKDPKGSKFSKLKAKVAKTTKKSNKITWSKVKGAKKYIVMGNKCGKTKGKFNKFKKLKTTKGTSFTHSKLKKNTYYKYVVLAVNGKGKVITSSKVMHVATKGGKNTNYKKITLNKKSKTLKKGKTFKLKIKKLTKMNKKGKVQNHMKTRYESANTKIATVNSKGKIKAKKKGTTYVYAYAQNGVFAKIKIKVK